MEAQNSSKMLYPPANDTASHPRTLLRPLSDLKNRTETQCFHVESTLNLLKTNDIYICRTVALTSRRYILNIYLTNIHTEYFKHAA